MRLRAFATFTSPVNVSGLLPGNRQTHRFLRRASRSDGERFVCVQKVRVMRGRDAKSQGGQRLYIVFCRGQERRKPMLSHSRHCNCSKFGSGCRREERSYAPALALLRRVAVKGVELQKRGILSNLCVPATRAGFSSAALTALLVVGQVETLMQMVGSGGEHMPKWVRRRLSSKWVAVAWVKTITPSVGQV